MAANSESFPWPNHYGQFQFFESRMQVHDRVRHLTVMENGIYELTKDTGQTIRVFICECYVFGIAEYLEVVERLGRVDAVVIDSVWCGYTGQAKAHCRAQKVGLFKIGEFMGALNQDDFWEYVPPEKQEKIKKVGGI
jgi:hypothetical protein